MDTNLSLTESLGPRLAVTEVLIVVTVTIFTSKSFDHDLNPNLNMYHCMSLCNLASHSTA